MTNKRYFPQLMAERRYRTQEVGGAESGQLPRSDRGSRTLVDASVNDRTFRQIVPRKSTSRMAGGNTAKSALSPAVGQVLVQCAESCERALFDYRTRVGGDATHDLFRSLLVAIATVRTAVDLLETDDPGRKLALRLTDEACTRAAAQCRRHGFDEPLLRCAGACERAADEVQLVLAAPAMK